MVRLTVRVILGCVLAATSGLLLTLCFAPYDVWPLVWIGFVPMAIAQHRILPPSISGAAPAIGVGVFVAGCFGGVFFPGASPWYLKLLPLLVGATTFLASRGERARLERTRYAGWPLQAAITWVAIELARLFVPGLATWGLLGHALYRQSGFLRPVSVFGLFGLDLMIVVANYALAQLAIALFDRQRPADRSPIVYDDRAIAVGVGYSRGPHGPFRLCFDPPCPTQTLDVAHWINAEVSFEHRYQSGIELRAYTGVATLLNRTPSSCDTGENYSPACVPHAESSPFFPYIGFALGYAF